MTFQNHPSPVKKTILISGICGFVGSPLARERAQGGHSINGFDNFSRPSLCTEQVENEILRA
jgi:CDP-paratose 2-epimerase